MNNLYRTLFFVPGNNPAMLMKSEIYKPDCIIYDLEDAVSIAEKDAARILVATALKNIRPNITIGIRVNGMDTPYFQEDIQMIAPLCPNFIRLPKSENPEDIKKLDAILTKIELDNKIDSGSIKIICTIETALGVYRTYDLATASPRVIGVGLGAEDFCTDMKTKRSPEGTELRYARYKLVMDARAAKVMAFDFVYSDIKNIAGFTEDTSYGKQLGYSGRSVVHPDQIPIVHKIFTPSEEEINHAKEVLAAYEEAKLRGSGVISLHGKMIDMPMVIRAQDLLSYAEGAQ